MSRTNLNEFVHPVNVGADLQAFKYQLMLCAWLWGPWCLSSEKYSVNNFEIIYQCIYTLHSTQYVNLCAIKSHLNSSWRTWSCPEPFERKVWNYVWVYCNGTYGSLRLFFFLNVNSVSENFFKFSFLVPSFVTNEKLGSGNILVAKMKW